jgi:hypothetical protein
MPPKPSKPASGQQLEFLNKLAQHINELRNRLNVLQGICSDMYMMFPAGRDLQTSLIKRDGGTGIVKGLNHKNVFCIQNVTEDLRKVGAQVRLYANACMGLN